MRHRDARQRPGVRWRSSAFHAFHFTKWVSAEFLRITLFPHDREAHKVDGEPHLVDGEAEIIAEEAQKARGEARQVDGETQTLDGAARTVDKMQSSLTNLMFFPHVPTSHCMKSPPSGLLVGLHDKLKRIARHWVVVDQALPPAHPLVLLSDVGCGRLDELMDRLRERGQVVRAAEQKLKLARAWYEERKWALHPWLRDINILMRGKHRRTPWFALVKRVPGRGQSYQHWWDAATCALNLWMDLAAATPAPAPGPNPWPRQMCGGRAVEQFEAAVKAFEAARWAINPLEVDLKMARGALEAAQVEATDLLMAYGHGVRARLGQRGALVKKIPQLWPKDSASSGRKRKRSRARRRQRSGLRR